MQALYRDSERAIFWTSRRRHVEFDLNQSSSRPMRSPRPGVRCNHDAIACHILQLP